jgi:4-hydroxybutyrate CoA-transferase
MADWKGYYRQHCCTSQQAVQAINSNYRVFLSGNASVPQRLLAALLERGSELNNVEIVHVLTMGNADYLLPEKQAHFRLNTLFAAHNTREAVRQGIADFTPVYLSDIPNLLRNELRPDTALLHLSVPDENGYCSFGTEIGVTRAAAYSAQTRIAEINPQMPHTYGDSLIHVTDLDHIVEVDYPLPEIHMGKPSREQEDIAYHISELIEDGSTLQLGIGGLPDVLLTYLGHKKRLGIHSELFSDGVIDLVKKGVITGESKTLHVGKIVAGFVLGTQRLYNFVHKNQLVEFYPTDYINDPFVIARNNDMVSINSALEVDLIGQICADSIGHNIYSGVGGQVDFTRGAAHSRGGKPIIALPSTAKNGSISRIVWELKPGAGVSVPRNEVHYVVTEFGVAYLRGKTLSQRAQAMINIAHPDFREMLLAQAHAAHYLPKIFPAT